MNKFAEAYPGNESKGKRRFAVVYCGHSAYGEKRSRDVEISYFIDFDCVDDADKNPGILKDIITSNIKAFNCTSATLFMVFPPKEGNFMDSYIKLSDWDENGMIEE